MRGEGGKGGEQLPGEASRREKLCERSFRITDSVLEKYDHAAGCSRCDLRGPGMSRSQSVRKNIEENMRDQRPEDVEVRTTRNQRMTERTIEDQDEAPNQHEEEPDASETYIGDSLEESGGKEDVDDDVNMEDEEVHEQSPTPKSRRFDAASTNRGGVRLKKT